MKRSRFTVEQITFALRRQTVKHCNLWSGGLKVVQSSVGHRVFPRFRLAGRTSTLTKNHVTPLRGGAPGDSANRP